MTTYHAEACERCVRGRTITIVNLTPEFRRDERNAAKISIEQRLYEIFCKYVPSQD